MSWNEFRRKELWYDLVSVMAFAVGTEENYDKPRSM
jgi:hypothetical protein